MTGEVVGDLPQLRVVPSDPSDDVIVATALKAGAQYLVTGDRICPPSGATGASKW